MLVFAVSVAAFPPVLPLVGTTSKKLVTEAAQLEKNLFNSAKMLSMLSVSLMFQSEVKVKSHGNTFFALTLKQT